MQEPRLRSRPSVLETRDRSVNQATHWRSGDTIKTIDSWWTHYSHKRETRVSGFVPFTRRREFTIRLETCSLQGRLGMERTETSSAVYHVKYLIVGSMSVKLRCTVAVNLTNYALGDVQK